NLGGWLTTVVARVALDMLRSRQSRREEPWSAEESEAVLGPEDGGDPEHTALIADALGPALLVVLDTLAPVERVAFVLHDLFAMPFDEIAPIVERTPAAARQLASRARRRVQGAGTWSTSPGTDRVRQRAVVDAFLAASRGGNMDGLLAVLDPNVVIRADRAAAQMGAAEAVRGAAAVAETFFKRAQGARPALVNGAVGLVWAAGGQVKVVFRLAIAHDRIAGIDLIADPEEIGRMELEVEKG
ncbi:MAG TPA: sigma factor-like helix-turn-helix DNA-binding protein, partial [Thermoanaerobaculia bacterium]|nr:sigma factor-like helix-turn-helix DNA-binding protein [Thermoanaerobaculia bacterium]